MKNLISGVQWIIGLGLIPYAIAVIMPTWRWLLGVTLVIGGPLSALWIQHWIASSAPDYYKGPAGAIGIAYILIVTAAFAVGVGIRATTLIFAPKGLRLRYIVLIYVAGFAIVPVIPLGPSLWHEWNIRPPSEACSSATFHVKVANADFSIPASPIFSVYLANTSSRDAYYFYSNSSLRGFCRLSDNGKQAVTATKISFRFDGNHFDGYRNSAPTTCAGSVPESAKTFCIADAKPAEIDSIDFPPHVTLGELDGSRSTYEDSQRATRTDGSVFITSEALTPDQHPLTFECAESGTGYWCKTSYPWSDGTILNYVFRSPRGDVAARGGRIDVETRKFLSGFAAQHRS